MASVESVKLGITAHATKPGFSLISYSYELRPSASDCAQQRTFTVTVELWGEDVFDDDVLATDLDEHTVTFDPAAPCEPTDVERAFEVETKVLNEDLIGEDEVYLIVEARSDGDRASGKSNTVTGDFS